MGRQGGRCRGRNGCLGCLGTSEGEGANLEAPLRKDVTTGPQGEEPMLAVGLQVRERAAKDRGDGLRCRCFVGQCGRPRGETFEAEGNEVPVGAANVRKGAARGVGVEREDAFGE